ncbi:unnamed protein product, partial [Rotaria socialis]
MNSLHNHHHRRPRRHYRRPAPVFRYSYGQPYGYGYAQPISSSPYASNYSGSFSGYPITPAYVPIVHREHHHGGASACASGVNLGAGSSCFGGGGLSGYPIPH